MVLKNLTLQEGKLIFIVFKNYYKKPFLALYLWAH